MKDAKFGNTLVSRLVNTVMQEECIEKHCPTHRIWRV